jgi:[Skp1-protein]-hydroxyproline N-acetylglucosaminyltransferase
VVDQRERSTDTSCYDSILKYCSGDTSLLHHESEEVSVEEGILVCQQYKHLIDVYDMDAQYGVGPVYARHVGYRMYRGEYYALQVDAHVFFVKEWDVQIIHQFRSTGNEMAVLTTYLTDLENSIDPTTHMSKVFSRPIMCETDWETNDEGNRFYLRNGQQPENEPFVKGTPQLEPYWAAGFSFGRGHFVMQVPYDAYLPMIFQGEEINIGLRAFTYGYDFYAPEFSVCFHMYASGKNAKKRNRIKMFWEHQDRYPGVEDHSYDRLTHILKLDGDDLLTETSTSTWDRTDSDIYGKFQRTYLKCFPRSQMGHFL